MNIGKTVEFSRVWVPKRVVSIFEGVNYLFPVMIVLGSMLQVIVLADFIGYISDSLTEYGGSILFSVIFSFFNVLETFLLFVVSIYAAIIIHEYGHYMMAEYYERDPSITMCILGGWTVYGGVLNRSKYNTMDIIMVGPLTNFLVGVVSILVGLVSGIQVFSAYVIIFGIANIILTFTVLNINKSRTDESDLYDYYSDKYEKNIFLISLNNFFS